MTSYSDDDPSYTTDTPSFRFKWDVFLSFRGEDTRHNFTENLYRQLTKNGIRTFHDEEELERGGEIAAGLIDAIEDSAAAIAVISKSYANSRWCLEELARIIECKRGLMLLPVFYQVDPSDVRRQRGPFHDDFTKLEERFEGQDVERWRTAMNKAGSIKGWHSKLWDDENKLIDTLVKKILAKLSNAPLEIPKYAVGLNSRIQELIKMLDIKGNGVKFLGIYGMGGAGKSTLAMALFNKLVVHFNRRSVVSKIREVSKQKNGLQMLQNRLMNDISQRASPNASLREMLHNIEEPSLVILDDIDNATQIEALTGKKHWFYEGSRIIITTRDRHAISGIVNFVYEMNGLNSSEALQLFSYHALGRENPLPEFTDISKKIVSLTGNLPLALEVFGSFLFDKRTKELWIEALKKLQQNPSGPGKLQEVLEISFNALDEQQKCAFLDMACLFVKMEMKREEIVYILKGNGFSGEILIRELSATCLIKIIEGDTLWMHDQIRDMGRRIVQQENSDPGLRSRIWDCNEILNVIKNDKGTRNIEGIALDVGKDRNQISAEDKCWFNFLRRRTCSSAIMYLKEIIKRIFYGGADDVILNTESFEQMLNLRLLMIDDVILNGSFKQMPADLKFLQWKGCPLTNFPSDFSMQDLAVLDLSESKFRKLWEPGFFSRFFTTKRAEKLLVLNLEKCYRLIDLPDLSAHSSLEKLTLMHCKELIQIHKSVGDLKKLIHLNLENCSNLAEFPSDVSGLKLLQTLNLSGCFKIKALPGDMRSMKSLKELLLDSTAIVNLPDTLFHLNKLEILSLKDCKLLKHLPVHIEKLNSLKKLSLDGSGLEELPDSIGFLKQLEILDLRKCRSVTEIPDSIRNLKSLIDLLLDFSPIGELPDSVGSLSHLKILSVSYCRSLMKLPDSVGDLASLVELRLNETSVTEIPNQVGSLSMVQRLEMGNCRRVRVLPESIGMMLNLTTLILNNSMISELPESIGMLERLGRLRLTECKELKRLPASIGNLKSLQFFYMEKTSVSELPNEIGNLSNLLMLKMRKQQSCDTESILPNSWSGLSKLGQFDAYGWKFCGAVPDEFVLLSSLEILNFSYNNISSLPSKLRDLPNLKDLVLSNCKHLKSLPLLPPSLVRLNIANCTALESIQDLSHSNSLQDLNATNCNELTDIPGLECLKSLRRLYLSGSFSCLQAVKEKLSKVALKRLLNLSIPGSKIPEWFVQEIPRLSTPRNLDIKGVIIGVVLSLDQQAIDGYTDELQTDVVVQAKVFRLDEDRPIFTTALKLIGIPNADEDQLYLCRYFDFQPLILMLKDGDRIEISLRERPYLNGLQLKKYGIHLIFENDDDIEDDNEESFDESQWSVSWKLAKFIGSL